MTPALFVAAARRLKGARWRHRGRKPWAVDCIGLVVLSARDCGLPISDSAGYGRESWDDRLSQGCRSLWGDPLPAQSARAGDVVVIRWGRGEPTHAAIIGDHPDGGLTLIHAHILHGVVEHSLTDRFAAVIVEVYRPWDAHVH